MFSCNVAGLEGVWRLIRLIKSFKHHERPAVTLVQEACCDSDNLKAVSMSLGKLGYKCYSSECVSMPKRAREQHSRTRRGVMTWVRDDVRSAFVGTHTVEDSQCLLVQVGDVLVINSYGVPGDEAQMNQAAQVHEQFHCSNWKGKWVAAGDWNQPWVHSWISTFAQLEGGDILDMTAVRSTRWSSSRIIDYPIANFHVDSKCTTRTEKISDHKILQWKLPMNEIKLTELRFPSKPQWYKPKWLTSDRWHLLFQHAFDINDVKNWEQVFQGMSNLHTSPASLDVEGDHDQAMVDFTWQLTLSKLGHCFKVASQLALLEIPSDFMEINEIKRVEDLASNNWLSAETHDLKARQMPKHGKQVSMKFRKLIKYLGRCHELRRHLQEGRKCAETDSLLKKLFGSEDMNISLDEIDKIIQATEAAVQKDEKEQKDEAIRKWEDQMKSNIKQRAQWLHRKTTTCLPAVGTPQQHTSSKQSAASQLVQYWRDFYRDLQWTQQDERTAASELAEFYRQIAGPLQKPVCAPELADFQKALRGVNGCAGIDGWNKQELSVIASSSDASALVWEAMQIWLELGITPTCIQHCRVSMLPKEGKIVDHSLVPGQFRPISLLSSFWRAFSSTWIKSSAVFEWAQSILPRTVAGGLRGALGPEVMAAMIDHQLQQTGFGITMDFKHAFDAVNFRVMRDALLPSAPPFLHSWIRTTCFQWEHLHKWISYGGHIHNVPIAAGMGLPQGDGSSPLFMTLLLYKGFQEVREQVGNEVFQCIFMDDRTAVAHSYEQLVAIQNVWRNFAQRFHLIENVDKAQLVDMTGATAHLGTKNSFEVLGTILGKPSVLEFRKFGRLMQRFNKSLHMAHRVAMLPESTSAKHHDICVFSGAAMAYGWIGTDPLQECVKKYNSKMWESLGHFRYGIAGLKSIMTGASLELGPNVLWRQIRTLAKRNLELLALGHTIHDSPLQQLVHRSLVSLGWVVQNDQWSHAELSFEFCFSEVVDDKKWRKISHWLRESFRYAHFFDLTPSHRHELENTDITSYSYERVGLARKWVSTHGDALSLAIGATMSARVRQEGKCPVCNMRNPVWDHVWSCTLGMTPPDDVLLRRFGWPRSVHDFALCNQLLAAVSTIRDGG